MRVHAGDATVVRFGGDLDWQSFDIPGGTVPVHLVRLHVEPGTRASTLLVRFPKGWRRDVAGSYVSAEDFLVIEGELTMCGRSFEAGDWGYVAAGALRTGMAAVTQVLTLARFAGPARWTEGSGTATEPVKVPALGAARAEEASPLGGSARLLSRMPEVSAWVLDAAPAAASVDAEVYAIDERAWTRVAAGEGVPQLDGRCFCRTFEANTGGSA
jgi:hypothetical protein